MNEGWLKEFGEEDETWESIDWETVHHMDWNNMIDVVWGSYFNRRRIWQLIESRFEGVESTLLLSGGQLVSIRVDNGVGKGEAMSLQ